MNKEVALFNWLKDFNAESHTYRINHLPSGINEKYAQLSLDNVVVVTVQEYVSGTAERELTYILQFNQKLLKDMGSANAYVSEIRDALADWLLEQSQNQNFPAFDKCWGYRINTEPQLNLAYEIPNNMARFQLHGSISFIEPSRIRSPLADLATQN